MVGIRLRAEGRGLLLGTLLEVILGRKVAGQAVHAGWGLTVLHAGRKKMLKI